MKETTVHGGAVERAERASVGIGEDRLGAVVSDDFVKALRYFVQGIVPGDALENFAGGDARATWAFRNYTPHGIQNPVRRVHAIQILGDFGAKETARHRVLGIALDFGGASVLDGDQNAASIRAIMRTGGVDDALHLQIIR